MGSRDTSARSASEVIGKIQHLVDIQRNARKRYCVRIKSAVVCVDLREHLVFHAIQSSNGLKKSSWIASFERNARETWCKWPRINNNGVRWIMVICSQKSKQSVDMDCTLSQNTASCCLRGRRSKQEYLSKVVECYSRRIENWALFFWFLECLSDCHSWRATLSSR